MYQEQANLAIYCILTAVVTLPPPIYHFCLGLVHELYGNMACQRGFTHWRGGRSTFVSSEMRHMANKNSLAGEEEEGGVGWRAWKCGMLQKRALPGGGGGGGGLGSSEMRHVAKRGVAGWRGGGGRGGGVGLRK